MSQDRASDVDGLREFLDALPQGEGLMYLGALLDENETLQFTIGDHLWGLRAGSLNGWHGVPQRDRPRWGLFLSDRSWERAEVEKWRVDFRDDQIPLEHVGDAMVLRPDKTGLAFLSDEISDWYYNTDRKVDFLGKPFVNGPYTATELLYLFDLSTRDLWVKM
jgi:hypothetical protein